MLSRCLSEQPPERWTTSTQVPFSGRNLENLNTSGTGDLRNHILVALKRCIKALHSRSYMQSGTWGPHELQCHPPRKPAAACSSHRPSQIQLKPWSSWPSPHPWHKWKDPRLSQDLAHHERETRTHAWPTLAVAAGGSFRRSSSELSWWQICDRVEKSVPRQQFPQPAYCLHLQG